MIRPDTTTLRRAGAVLLAAVGMVAAATATASAAGSSTGNAHSKQLVASSFGAASRASSVTLTGSGVDSGQTFGIDLTEDSNGNAAGTITTQGQTLHIVKVGRVGYLKANAAFWQQAGGTDGSAVASLVANRWIKASGAKSPLAGFNQIIVFHTFFGGFSKQKLRWSVARRTTFGGHAAYAISGTQNGQTGQVVVAAGSPGYPLEIKAPGNQGAFVFTNWDHGAAIHAPHGAIDLSTLGG